MNLTPRRSHPVLFAFVLGSTAMITACSASSTSTAEEPSTSPPSAAASESEDTSPTADPMDVGSCIQGTWKLAIEPDIAFFESESPDGTLTHTGERLLIIDDSTMRYDENYTRQAEFTSDGVLTTTAKTSLGSLTFGYSLDESTLTLEEVISTEGGYTSTFMGIANEPEDNAPRAERLVGSVAAIECGDEEMLFELGGEPSLLSQYIRQ